MMTVEKMIAWLRDNDTPDDHETRLQIADEFEKHVNSLVISGGMYRSKQAELETALLRLDAARKDLLHIAQSHPLDARTAYAQAAVFAIDRKEPPK